MYLNDFCFVLSLIELFSYLIKIESTETKAESDNGYITPSFLDFQQAHKET